MTDWFHRLTGFHELEYEATREKLEVVGDRLRSRVNGRSYGIGTLEIASLAELRARAREAAPRIAGRLRVSHVSGDVRALHADPQYARALFQVASQFNLLEMTGPHVTPEDGVTRYASDPTQGPACAIAAGAATIYRNYFVPVDGERGQTRERQIDCLRDLGAALGNEANRLWTMRNGYALCTKRGLEAIDRELAEVDDAGIDRLRGVLHIGLQWEAEATEAKGPAPQFVSQAFCSALPVSYWVSLSLGRGSGRGSTFARLVLEAAYEATMWAAVINAQARGSNIVLLTRLGGGAFGNESEWIEDAMTRALDRVRDMELDVRVVSRG